MPALNEGADIQRVVKEILPFAQPIVVDDGSTDNTAELARRAGALVVKHDHGKGYDAALESGLFYALDAGYEYAVTMDADGQHSPEELEIFRTKLAAGADLVVGQRDRWQRRSEALFSRVSSLLWGVHDPLCGMKGYRLERLRQIGHFDSYRSIGTEFTVRAARSKWCIAQVPVPTRARIGSSRFGSGLRANWRIVRALILGLFLARRQSLFC
jgi:glycosyltransferase involved in cell wall biosynthesis